MENRNHTIAELGAGSLTLLGVICALAGFNLPEAWPLLPFLLGMALIYAGMKVGVEYSKKYCHDCLKNYEVGDQVVMYAHQAPGRFFTVHKRCEYKELPFGPDTAVREYRHPDDGR